MRKIKIGTRASKLALWQAEFISQKLKKKYPEIEIELVKIKTTGDKILDSPLAKIGGKGLFTKELEIKMSVGEIDLAVHSLKDVPTELPEEFKIAAITKRTQPFDAFVSNKFSSLDELPKNSVLGTSSLRRSAQILKIRPDLQIKNLRGNVETRLKKLDAGEFDAIILAAAGLERLGYSERITKILPEIIPAAGQGALAVEVCKNNFEVAELLKFLNDDKTFVEVNFEREFMRLIEGGCQIPAGIFSNVEGENIFVRAVISSLDGKNFVMREENFSIKNIEVSAKIFAEKMLNDGGREILKNIVILA